MRIGRGSLFSRPPCRLETVRMTQRGKPYVNCWTLPGYRMIRHACHGVERLADAKRFAKRRAANKVARISRRANRT